jgi:hypothetical protein
VRGRVVAGRHPGWRAFPLVAVALVVGVAGVGPTAQASSAYRYWSYYVGAGSGWQYSQRGPAGDYPLDGEVQGWRFGVQGEAADLPPRAAPDFASICAGTAAATGRIRVGIVIDFGTTADAPSGEQPPAGPVRGCVSVADGASGIVVLDAAVGASGVRIGTGSDAGLVCGIAGYPRVECAVSVTGTPIRKPAPSPTPTTSPTPAARTEPPPSAQPIAPTQPAQPATPSPSTTATRSAAAAGISTRAAAPPSGNSLPETAAPTESRAASPTASTSAATSSAAPTSGSPAPPSTSSRSPLALDTLTVSDHGRSVPVSAVLGTVVIVALAVAGGLRLRRNRRAGP